MSNPGNLLQKLFLINNEALSVVGNSSSVIFSKTCCAKRPQIKLERKLIQEILSNDRHDKKTANLDSRQKEKNQHQDAGLVEQLKTN